jgi:plastocyanin domain-containing protein
MRHALLAFLAVAVLAVAVSPATAAGRRPRTQTAVITVTGEGYSPGTIRLRRNVPARITFVRTSEVTCGAEVVFPALGIRRELPLNTPVVIRFTPRKAGTLSFACGMDMWHGAVIVR